MSEVTVGSRWYVWGRHQTVEAERFNVEFQEREVLLVPDGYAGQKKRLPWVADRRVSRRGILSQA